MGTFFFTVVLLFRLQWGSSFVPVINVPYYVARTRMAINNRYSPLVVGRKMRRRIEMAASSAATTATTTTVTTDEKTADSVRHHTEDRMKKCVESVQKSLLSVRTGRANPSLLDRVQVKYYGLPTPLHQIASISVANAQQLTVEPYDTTLLRDMERSIVDADLGLNPQNDGTIIRLQIPPLTEERRLTMLKQCKSIGEDGKVAIRNVRRDGVDAMKKIEPSVGKDQSMDGQRAIQKLTDTYISNIETIIDKKDKEVMTV
mmetsp:Transcript_22431/g.40470  ORF Transcript_22431/g.40470 Transcript_22431/m.40470 type:complete len:259 (-) Transcript_22431:70-846(-)|eukprot:CAMPEP_0198296646 /NCGR_PEP_ID=MMETSP1449-20131203/33270_1 /TAXON_ID=420275 /ORGANISM="Attheya septentrionalis, Strain CCMP2084" /LENGTH=258 /DNA_ID=CAMNT_0043997313 /DNA_START=225 /DNA_END=1001 /DNA_ORIENTATION=+